MKTARYWLGAIAGAAALTGTGPAHAVVLPLDTATCGLAASDNCLQFEDAVVFSLALLNFKAGFGDVQAGDPFYVRSSGQPINDAIVIASSPAGRRDNQDLGLPGGGVDDAYETPENIPQVNFTNYLMTSEQFGDAPNDDPPPLITGDNVRQADTEVNNDQTYIDNELSGVNPPPATLDGMLPLWDINVGSLQSFLTNPDTGLIDDLVFWYNLNETNGGFDPDDPEAVLSDGQDMLTWARVYLSDETGTLVDSWDLSGNLFGGPNPFQSQEQTADVDDILPEADDQWAYVHGEICVAPSGEVLFLGECATADHLVSQGDPDVPDLGDLYVNLGSDVNQNLGAGNAAFAIYQSELSDLIQNPANAGWTMSVDFRMGRIDNGYEQLFILPVAATTTTVPEPGTLVLVGLGLGAVGLAARRRRPTRSAA